MSAPPANRLAITLAQLNPIVGDVSGNAEKARAARKRAAADGADLVIFPELFIAGYSPADLVLKPAFQAACRAAVESLARETADGGPALILGTPWVDDGKLYNAVALLDGGAIAALRFKVDLPNYGVFDEKRVFVPGPMPGPVNFRGVRLGIPVCEDIWREEVVECLAETGSELLLVPNGSPYWGDKDDVRLNIAVAPRRPDQERRPAVRRLPRERLDLPTAGGLERRLEHQVFRRIAGDEHFGKRHHVGAQSGGLIAGAANLVGIAGNVADGRVELRQRDLQAIGGTSVHGNDLAGNFLRVILAAPISAFTHVFDALWARTRNPEATL